MLRFHPSARAGVALLCASAPWFAQAQDVSRVVAATIYLDGAVVERQLRTPGGTRHVEIACMPPGFRTSTLQVDGDASVRLGDVRTEPASADDALACARGSANARLRALDDQKAALQAQSHADELAVDYLRRWNGGSGEPVGSRPNGTAGATHAMPAADSLRKSALDLMTDQLRVAHQVADVEREIQALQKTAHHGSSQGNWSTLRLDVATAAAGTLRLRYEVSDTRWTPSYRAALDTATATLHLDRLAEISQGSGEDWNDVALTLSTGWFNRVSSLAMPDTWNLQVSKLSTNSSGNSGDVQRVMVTSSSINRFAQLPPPAPAPAAAAIDHTPIVRLGAEERDWGTQFHASQPVTMASDAQTHTLPLDSRTLPVQLRVRAIPQQGLAAYLVADAPRPDGIWPGGKLQTWRDGTLVANDDDWQLDAEDGDRLSLDFGRDDRVRISVQRPASMNVAAGFFGSQTQRTWGSVFVITNEHATAQTLELIDMAPVSHDESVKVASTYDPAPTVTDWRHKPGVDAWTLQLAPGQTRRVSVTHQVTFPKDVVVSNLPSGG